MSGYTVSTGQRADISRSDRRFYTGMALAMALLVFAGFAPTFYLKPLLGAPPLSPLVLVHGLVFTAWVLMLLAQASLVAKGRTDLHRRLGIAGALLAAILVVVGMKTAITAVALGHVPPGAPPPLSFFIIPFFSIVLFAIFTAAGLCLRGDPETHKRLMLLGTIAMLGAAIARLPFPFASVPPAFFAIADLFIVAGIVHDLRTRGRVHRAYIWGGLFMVLSQPVQLAILGTSTWLAFAGWLTG